MPSTRPTVDPVLDILEEMGYDFDELDGDGYKRSLKEAIIKLTIKDPKDPRIGILTLEFQKVKGSRKVEPKEKRTVIRGDKLMGREPKKDAPSPTAGKPKLLTGVGKFNTDDVKPADVDKKQKDSSDLKPDKLDSIAKTVESIALLLRRQFNLEKKQQRDSRRQQSKADKDAREDKLEGKPKDKKTGLLPKAIKKPALNFFEKLKTFFLNIAIGSGVMKLFEWLKNPENAEKITQFKDFLVNNAGWILGGLAAIALLPIALSLVVVVKGILAGLALLGPLLPLLPWILGGILVGAVAWWIGKKISKFITGGEVIGAERKENKQELRASGIIKLRKGVLNINGDDGKPLKVNTYGENSIMGRDSTYGQPGSKDQKQDHKQRLNLRNPLHQEWYVKNYGQEALDQKLAAAEKFETTKAALVQTKDDMHDELDAEKAKWKAAAIAKRDATGADKVDWETENKIWKEKSAEIRKKYEDKAVKIGDDGVDSSAVLDNDTKAVVDTETKANKIVPGPSTKNQGGVTVIDGGDSGAAAVDSYGSGGGETSEEDEMFSSEDPNDPSQFSSKSLYNMGG